MCDSSLRALAADWIAAAFRPAESPGGPGPKGDSASAAVRLLELTERDWRKALRVCEMVAELADDAAILQYLGAGPLEDILELGGAEAAEMTGAACGRNPRLRQAALSMWPCTDPAVWTRMSGILSKSEERGDD